MSPSCAKNSLWGNFFKGETQEGGGVKWSRIWFKKRSLQISILNSKGEVIYRKVAHLCRKDQRVETGIGFWGDIKM